jgi:hypothetical protein
MEKPSFLRLCARQSSRQAMVKIADREDPFDLSRI